MFIVGLYKHIVDNGVVYIYDVSNDDVGGVAWHASVKKNNNYCDWFLHVVPTGVSNSPPSYLSEITFLQMDMGLQMKKHFAL